MTRAGSSSAIPDLDGKGLRIAIIGARFNDHIVTNLRDGALRGLERLGVADSDIMESWVPGAFELPLAAKVLAETGKVDAIICLGTVIKGDTPHFEYICQGVTNGLASLCSSQDIPVIFGVLTVNTLQQALDRCGGIHGNKGDEAAITAIELADLSRRLKVGS